MIFSPEVEDRVRDLFDKSTTQLHEDVKSALWKFLQAEFWPEIKVNGHDIEFIVDFTAAYTRRLKLKSVGAVPQEKEGFFFTNSSLALHEETDRYWISGELIDPAEEISHPIVLSFEAAEVQIDVYNCMSSTNLGDSPWEYLQLVSTVVYLKSQLPGIHCNEKELALMPLITELVQSKFDELLPPAERHDFPVLKEYLVKYNYTKVIKQLEILSAAKVGSFKYIGAANRTFLMLSEKKYEPLWREVWKLFCESQEEYSVEAEQHVPAELLNQTRKEIQTLMEAKGYIGTYPDFIKIGSLPKIHLEESYGQTYFIGFEKRVMHRIHCFESCIENDAFFVQFLCGTALLKKNEPEEDIYSCLFDAKGRRLFRMMNYHLPLFEVNEQIKPDNLEMCVNIAVKKAELQKLTKEERQEYYGQSASGIGAFFFILIFGGGFFSIFFNFFMFLFGAAILALFGEAKAIPEMLTDLPWGGFVAFAWIAFGGIMGLITLLAKRK